LYLISLIGARGGTGHVIEYAGSTIEALSPEGRMTICNMSIEAGAKAGMIAPDQNVLDYLSTRPYSPPDQWWEQASRQWLSLSSDADATFDKDISVDVSRIEPTVTWGTSPETGVSISDCVPTLNSVSLESWDQFKQMLAYMGLEPGVRMKDVRIDQVFIGSCTNSRIEDLRLAASVVQGRKVKAHVSALIVPGSMLVQAQARAEGLDRIFVEAGFEWGSPGCSMCVAMNGDSVNSAKRSVSTSNRNFMGRQGPGSRTHLASPMTAAASALTGYLTDVREML
jgi:3-isopropylmalate/(R)-2-methylmalate dehydratase large subunit